MTRSQAQDIINWICGSNVTGIVLGGNEPIYAGGSSVRDSLLPMLISKLSDAGIDVAIVTSGLTAVLLERHWPAAFARLAAVAVSLDAPSEAQHNASRGAPLFGLASTALKLCSAYEVISTVLVTGMRWNFYPAELAGFCQIAKDHAAYVRVNVYKSTRGLADPLSVTPEQYVQGFSYLVTQTTSVVVEEPPLRSWFGLPDKQPNCGHTSGRLTLPDGNGEIKLTPCQYRADFATELPGSAREVPENGGDVPQCIDYSVYSCGKRPPGMLPMVADPAMRIFTDYLCTWVGRP